MLLYRSYTADTITFTSIELIPRHGTHKCLAHLNYGNTKTLPKARTQEWHLLNAAWAPSESTQ